MILILWCILPSLAMREITNCAISIRCGSKVLVVRGAYYKNKFINMVKMDNSFTVWNETTIMNCRVRSVANQKVISTEIKVGILYSWRFTYPVINCVGCLHVNDDKDPSLLFVQVSLSTYKKHDKKSWTELQKMILNLSWNIFKIMCVVQTYKEYYMLTCCHILFTVEKNESTKKER